jgi:subtilisin-like proprotein convertase family protein
MKKTLMILTLALTASWAQATLQPILNYTQNFGGGTILDGNPVGQVFTGNFNNAASWDQVVSLTVGLNVSGGYNGDLYAYLIAPNGTVMMLMNQPGVGVNGIGASGSGMNITLSSGNTGDGLLAPNSGAIQNETSGAYLGNPGNQASAVYSALGSLAFQTVSDAQNLGPTGSAANGTWTLYFADVASGGGNETLNSWTLNLAVVPEPVTLALGLFAAMLLALAGIKHFWQPRKGEAEDGM